MNPNDPTDQRQPNQPQNNQSELFAPRFNIPPRAGDRRRQTLPGESTSLPDVQGSQAITPAIGKQSPQAWQPSASTTMPHTSSSFPWNPTPPTQPHPAQPASPASNERYPLPLPLASPQMPAGNLPQYGGQMAELPPLNSETTPGQHIATGKSGKLPKSFIKVLLGGLIVLALLTLIGAAILVAMKSSNKSRPGQHTIRYNADQIKKLAASQQLNAAQLKKINATDTFYSAFRSASQQPVVRTLWDVFYTQNQKDERADQYSLYGVAMNYRTKQYTYAEDDHSNIGTIQYRCIGNEQYIYNGSTLSDASASWQPASDSGSCAFSSVATRVNDGMNTGNLNATQSDTLVQQLNKSGAVKIGGMQLVTQKNAQYIKLSVVITPQKQSSGVYWGMQNFMAAFNATGLNAAKQPYTYFGASGEGLSLDYYINPATMLPSYSVATSAPAYDANGKPAAPKTWSHKFVEYQFPGSLAIQNLNDHNLITFTTWSDN